jgi:phosphoribosyl-dephospho-CoA transferase
MVRTVTPFTFANPHDLLEIESPQSIEHLDAAPSWVQRSLAVAPFVVVRRAARSQDLIAVGVRGNSRSERWPGFVRPDRVKAVLSPFELRRKAINRARLDAVAALRHLQALEEKWHNLDYKWGPGGSVGFELASGYPSATPSSDLDIVLFAPKAFDHEQALLWLSVVQEIAASIDVIVEAPECAFLLGEYAASSGTAILLRCLDGPRLGYDPWRMELAGAVAQTTILVENAEAMA